MTGNQNQKDRQPSDMTLEYYNSNAQQFSDATINVDLRDIRDRFIAKLPAGSKVLDAGCGSGRDSIAFKLAGYKVVAFDASERMAEVAAKNIGQEVHHMGFLNIQYENEFDGIWACASLLHLDQEDLPSAFSKLQAALVSGGVLYVSFKLGRGERVDRVGRHFTDLNENGLSETVKGIQGLAVDETWITSDARPGREQEKWLNAILRNNK